MIKRIKSVGLWALFFFLLFGMVALLSGCGNPAEVQSRLIVDYNTVTGQVHFERYGDYEAGDVSVAKDANGVINVRIQKLKVVDAATAAYIEQMGLSQRELIKKIPDMPNSLLDAAVK